MATVWRLHLAFEFLSHSLSTSHLDRVYRFTLRMVVSHSNISTLYMHFKSFIRHQHALWCTMCTSSKSKMPNKSHPCTMKTSGVCLRALYSVRNRVRACTHKTTKCYYEANRWLAKGPNYINEETTTKANARRCEMQNPQPNKRTNNISTRTTRGHTHTPIARASS